MRVSSLLYGAATALFITAVAWDIDEHNRASESLWREADDKAVSDLDKADAAVTENA